MNIPLILIFNLILSFSLTKFFIKPFKKLIPDVPNKRSSHNIIKPRGGGLAFILTNLIASHIFEDVNFVFLLPLCLVGLADDFLDISRWFRFFFVFNNSGI